jgi:hypothetical protein
MVDLSLLDTSLPQFEYDVFLSYGWAGIPGERTGDRGWVGDFKAFLAAQLAGELGRRPRIFLDVEQSKDGELPDNLERAVQSSAVFISVVTRGACRAESWCRFELQRYNESYGETLRSARHLFVVQIRNVPNAIWPEEIRKVASYQFLTEEDDPGPIPTSELANSKEFSRLFKHIRDALLAVKKESTQTVWIAAPVPEVAAETDALSAEIRVRFGKLIRAESRPEESEAELTARLRHQLRYAGMSVHVLNPPGQPSPLQHLQLELARERFGQETSRIIVWQKPLPGAAALPPSPAAAYAQDLTGYCFNDLASHVLECLTTLSSSAELVGAMERRRTVAASAAGSTVVPGMAQPVAPAGPRRVYLEGVKQDHEKIALLQEQWEREGLIVRIPFFEGDENLRRTLDSRFLERCDAVGVYFGTRTRLEATLACQDLYDMLAARAEAIPKAVFLDPCESLERRTFSFEGFRKYPCQQAQEFARELKGGQ